MFNIVLPVLLATGGLLDCETYHWLTKDLIYPGVDQELRADIQQTIREGTDPTCFNRDANAD